MAAIRSPSTNPSRPLNSRPNALRKSGIFNLSKSSSGSEVPQRSSGSKSASALPSQRSSFEQKENQRDPNYSRPARTRSPAINPSKGMKSFMAPTISASSKITAASPRKKILAEKNQVVRDSMENSSVSDDGVKEEITRKPEIGFDSEEISGRSRSRKLDFSSSKSHHPSEATHFRSLDVGPFDADPSFPPYDPMKNYLSPRPRFLHYKPSPRIEQHHEFLHDMLNETDGRRLEDSFSDSEGSVDCGELPMDAQSSPMKKESEDGNLMKMQQTQVPDENHVSESKPKPETYKPITRSFGRSKLIPFLLILTAVSFYIPLTDSPILFPSKMKDQTFTGPQTMPFRVLQDMHLYDYLDVASRNIRGLATWMRQWTFDSIEYFTSSGSFPKELDTSHSFNMTLSSSMVHIVGLDFCYSSDSELAEKNIIDGQNDLVDNMEIEFELDKTDVDALPSSDTDVAEKIKLKIEEDNNPKYERLYSLVDHAVQFGTMNKNDQPEKIESAIFEVVDGEGYPVGFDIAGKPEEQVLIELGKEESHPMNNEDIDSSVYPEVEPLMINKKDFDAATLNFLTQVQPFVFSDTKLMLALFGMLAVVALATTLAFLFIKQKRTFPASNEKPPNKKTRSVSGDTKGYRHANGDSFFNRGGLAEMVSDSGPTEMSFSFNNSLSFSKQRSKIGSHEVTPSHEIMQRRESGVSSSISYGSFTSFEKRSARKGNKQEEVMTPVRRSSRIKYQISSP